VLANGRVLVSSLELTLATIQAAYISKNDRASSAGFSHERPNHDGHPAGYIERAPSRRRKAFVSTEIGVVTIRS